MKVSLDSNLSYEVDGIFKEGKSDKPVLLLMHGFSQSAEIFYDKVKSFLPDDMTHFAPSGPLYLPIKEEGEYKMRYAWYFFNFKTAHYFTKMSQAVEYLKVGLKKFDLLDRELIVIGYSQGGYVAPYLACENLNIKKVIGLNARLKNEDLDPKKIKSYYLGLHGEKDEMVDCQISKDAFEDMKSRGLIGDFEVIPGVRHGLSGQLLGRLKRELTQ